METTVWLFGKVLLWAMEIPKYNGGEALYLVLLVAAVIMYFIDMYASRPIVQCKHTEVKRIDIPMNNSQWWIDQVIQGR